MTCYIYGIPATSASIIALAGKKSKDSMNYKDEAVLFTTPDHGNFGNIELLAAEIASLVPELARDNPTNRAEVIKNLILREQERVARVHVNVKR